MPKAICKSGDCDFTDDNYEEKRCPKCGKEVLYNCPECNYPIKSTADNTCRDCGHSYKDEFTLPYSPVSVVRNDR